MENKLFFSLCMMGTISICTVSCTQKPKASASYFSMFIKSQNLIKAEPDIYRYSLSRLRMDDGKIKVHLKYCSSVPRNCKHADFIFDKAGKIKSLAKVQDPALYRKLEDMATRFYKLDITAFEKDFSGNSTYAKGRIRRPRLVEIRDMGAYMNGKNQDQAVTQYKDRVVYMYGMPQGPRLTHYIGNFYVERSADLYYDANW